MKYKMFTAAIMAAFLTLGCSTRDDDGLESSNVDDCLNFGSSELRLTIQESFTTLPSKVSVFFKVTDNDGNGVSNLLGSNFRVFEKGRNDDCPNEISSAESSGDISPNAQIFKNNAFLVLDLSNSVLSTSLTELKQASISFVNNVVPQTQTDSFRMAIYWFDGENELHLLQPLTSDITTLEAAINGITTDISNDPSTDLYGAVIKATAVADDVIDTFEQQEIFAAASVVIFTDGTDQAARFTKAQALQSVRNADADISIFTIGLGSEIDQQTLSQIGKTGSVVAENSAQLEQVFNTISENVSGEANSFYLFEYCSPKRDGSGTNELTIQAFDGDRQGSVETSFNAEGFTSGCTN
ncbi:VWA domain-containing protein [Dokdonia sinensis]|uniref:VWA domain-containing protein n=1 Tax=Dokdonia sinensis TaxID=2479847 RepID=A0A3M0G7I2_9FLAO|nr:VWA domain-containing protein [Dokdonia sinensis]RMB60874.1 VWA domain-containing protein [Dokdonia sinensis]